VRNRLSIEGFKIMKEEKAKEYLAEYKATFSSKSKSDENPFTTEKGIQKIMCSMYKNVFGCAPFSGKGEKQMIDGKRVNVYKYNDEPCEKWDTMKTLQDYSKLKYVKKVQDKYEHDNQEVEYGFDSDSDDE